MSDATFFFGALAVVGIWCGAMGYCLGRVDGAVAWSKWAAKRAREAVGS